MVKRKGARPSPKNPNAVGHARSALIVLPARSAAEPAPRVPPLPRSYAPEVRREWADYWRSPVASAVNRGADMPALRRWAWCLNELAAIMPLVSGPPGGARMLKTGDKLVVNPLTRLVAQYMSEVRTIEIEFGMTPLSRSRLGATIGAAKLTAQELNRRLAEAPGASTEPAWAEEWEDA